LPPGMLKSGKYATTGLPAPKKRYLPPGRRKFGYTRGRAYCMVNAVNNAVGKEVITIESVKAKAARLNDRNARADNK